MSVRGLIRSYSAATSGQTLWGSSYWLTIQVRIQDITPGGAGSPLVVSPIGGVGGRPAAMLRTVHAPTGISTIAVMAMPRRSAAAVPCNRNPAIATGNDNMTKSWRRKTPTAKARPSSTVRNCRSAIDRRTAASTHRATASDRVSVSNMRGHATSVGENANSAAAATAVRGPAPARNSAWTTAAAASA